jgi:hypothetical protein
MSGDCDGCVDAVAECAKVLAALVRRLGKEEAEISPDELAAFTPNTAVVFTPGDTDGSLKVVVREVDASVLFRKETSCGS